MRKIELATEEVSSGSSNKFSQLLTNFRQSVGAMKITSFILLGLLIFLAIWLFSMVIDLIRISYPDFQLPAETPLKIIIGVLVGFTFFRSAIDAQPQPMIYWSVIFLIILVPLLFWQGIYQVRPERDQSIIIHRQRPVQEKVVEFGPGEKVHTGLVIFPGDTVQYKDVTAPFKVRGSIKPFHLVGESMIFGVKDQGEHIIYGGDKEGSVRIIVIPARK